MNVFFIFFFKKSFKTDEYKVASLNTTQVKGTGQPEFSTQFDGINVTLVNTASSTETGGGLQCTIGPINDRA